MSPGVPADALHRLLLALDALDRDGAVHLLRQLAAEGISLGVLVEQLLVPAQVEVGRRWEAGERSVTWEHAATAITDVALLSVAGGSPLPQPRGRVVVACAEQEWHSMPARMLAELLREEQWDAVLVGASAPADPLVGTLQRQRAFALLVSCTMTAHLPGARRLVEAGHTAGVPVMVGGRAFAAPARAAAVGADGRCTDAAEADALLSTWLRSAPPPPADVPVDREHLQLQAAALELLERVLAEVVPTPGPDGGNALERDLADLLSLVAAALLVGDDSIVSDGLRWQLRYRAARGDPGGIVTRQELDRLAALAGQQGLPGSQQLLAAAARQLATAADG